MRKVLPWTAGIWLSLGAMAWAHLCNNIYRTPDRIIVKPEKQVTTIERSDQFRVFVQNNYPTYLRTRFAKKLDPTSSKKTNRR